MYLIYGVSNKRKVLAESIQPFSCSYCGTVHNWEIYKSKPFFTLFFFLKLFPIGNYEYFYFCSND